MKSPFAFTRLAAFALTALLSLAHARARAQDGNNADKPLSAYRDKSRVLLLFAPSAQDPAFLEQTKLWQNEKPGFDERQLVTVPVLADSKRPAGDSPGALAKKFGIDAKAFAVVLIGKDGHDAYRGAKPVPAGTLYGVIDAMPMRRAEMKRPPAASPPPAPRATPAKPDVDHDE